MKKLISALLLVLLVLSGCSNKPTTEINVFMPGEYINEDVVTAFEKEYGIRVNINTFASNEEMMTKLLGGTVYDILIPSDYAIEELLDKGMLQELDKSLLTNLDQLYTGVQNMEYDPDNTYTVPYFWGNVGILYDTRKIDKADVEAQGWEVFRNPKYAGLTYCYDSDRDEFMIALKSLGYSMNADSVDQIEEAYNWLIEMVENVKPAFATDECIDGLAHPEETDKKYLGLMYNGDSAAIIEENEYAEFFVPETGTNYFVDAMCVHKDSDKLEESCKFINYMISYDAQYDNSEYVGYSSVNEEAYKDLANDVFLGNSAYAPRPAGVNDEVFHYNNNIKKIRNDYWIKVVGSQQQ